MNKTKLVIIALILAIFIIIVLIKSSLFTEIRGELINISKISESEDDFDFKYRAIVVLVYIVTGTIFSVIGYRSAKKRGDSKIKWVLTCFIFNIWGLMHLIRLAEKKANQ